jgi:hypothetical protein
LKVAPNGTNATRLFLNNPGEFLKKVPIIEHLQVLRTYDELDEQLKTPGKINFIFETFRDGMAVRLKPVLNTYRNLSDQENLQAQLAQGPQIQANWLPWKPDATTEITLDSTCPFFFTSQLAGCRLTIQRDDPTRPQIFHIAGAGRYGPTSTAWRDQETQRGFAELSHPSRTDILTSASGAPSESRYKDEGVNVVGVFDAAKNAWEFTKQAVDFENVKVESAKPWGKNKADQHNPDEAGRAYAEGSGADNWTLEPRE